MNNLMTLNNAAMSANRKARSSSFSLFALIEQESAKYGLDPNKVAEQYEKLFPGQLWPVKAK